MFLRLNNVFVTVNYIHKKQMPSTKRQFVFIFYNLLSMSRSDVFKRYLGKEFLGRQQVELLS